MEHINPNMNPPRKSKHKPSRQELNKKAQRINRGYTPVSSDSQKAIPIAQAGDYFHSEPTYHTIHRWTHKGLWSKLLKRFVVLDSFIDGQTRYVKIKDIYKFKNELNGFEEDDPQEDTP